MAFRIILQEGESTLTKKSRIITDFDERLHILLDDMRETLLEANGIGLAAPQVGVLRRAALVIDINREGENIEEQIIELINPEIIESDGEQEGSEGCLSMPDIVGVVKRPMRVKLKAYDRYGKPFEIEGEEITARAFCHEIDHLDGKLFTTLAKELYHVDEWNRLQHEERE